MEWSDVLYRLAGQHKESTHDANSLILADNGYWPTQIMQLSCGVSIISVVGITCVQCSQSYG